MHEATKMWLLKQQNNKYELCVHKTTIKTIHKSQLDQFKYNIFTVIAIHMIFLHNILYLVIIHQSFNSGANLNVLADL